MKVLIYKPTQNRKTQEIINDILKNIGNSINIIFTDNLCMLGSQTSDRIIKEVNGWTMYSSEISNTISINCESLKLKQFVDQGMNPQVEYLSYIKKIIHVSLETLKIQEKLSNFKLNFN